MAAELQRRAGERDQLETMKDEFVLTASHELRSPLTSVQGFAELLMLEREKLSPKQADTVEIILDNTRHLVRLLNDLLDLARSDAGRLTIKPAPTEVGAAGRGRGADDAQPDRERRASRCASEIEPGLPRVKVDRDRIRQVLVNLLTNAHEYSPEGASIEVTAARRDAEVEMAVSDNGPGMAEDQLEHIFERFTRGDAGLTQHVGGTGLGLAISKSLVELHGGTIERRVDARARARPSASACRRDRPRPRWRCRMMTRVLIADDSETILLLMRTRLEMEGYEVLTAADGVEVVETMRAADPRPDILLLDAMMPRKSGIDALRELRAEGLETPVLIVSAHQDEMDAGAATRASRSAATSPSRSTSTGCSRLSPNSPLRCVRQGLLQHVTEPTGNKGPQTRASDPADPLVDLGLFEDRGYRELREEGTAASSCTDIDSVEQSLRWCSQIASLL